MFDGLDLTMIVAMIMGLINMIIELLAAFGIDLGL